MDLRKELAFATLAQLVGFAKDDWETDRPDEATEWISELADIDYPHTTDDLIVGFDGLVAIMKLSKSWTGPIAEPVKKEMKQRILDYEQELQARKPSQQTASSLKISC